MATRARCARPGLACGQPPETNKGERLQQDPGETVNRHRLGGQMARIRGQIQWESAVKCVGILQYPGDTPRPRECRACRPALDGWLNLSTLP